MTDFIEIDGNKVDFDDPCAMVRALKKARVKVITGQGVVRTRFDQDDVEYSQSNLSQLNAVIAQFETDCTALSGGRRRGARPVRWS